MNTRSKPGEAAWCQHGLSTLKAIRLAHDPGRALARHFQLLHGPPGTGKTRTAAVLMTLFAQRNLGARCASLFGAPTNRAVDCALLRLASTTAYSSKRCVDSWVWGRFSHCGDESQVTA